MADKPLTWVDNLHDYGLWADGPNKVGFCRPDLPDGAAQWKRDDDGRAMALTYVCPCGCKEWRQVPVALPELGRVASTKAWAWNGDETMPTLTPSILHVANRDERCSWHGFLTAGVWLTC